MILSKKVHVTLFFLFFLYTKNFAIIFESDNLADVCKYADENSLVIFDIDHTIAEVSMGIEPWIHTKTDDLVKKGLSQDEAFQLVLAMYDVITNLTWLNPLSNSPAIVKSLQKRNIPVIALTNRSIPVMQKTISLLKNIGIDLSCNGLYKQDLDLAATNKGKYSHGIIFTGANDKGTMLMQFLHKIGYTPKKIIFADDGMRHIESVQKQAKKYNIPYVGMRFSLQDKIKRDFSHAKAEQTIDKLKVELGINPIPHPTKEKAIIPAKQIKLASKRTARKYSKKYCSKCTKTKCKKLHSQKANNHN